jgi:hypothetical protein
MDAGAIDFAAMVSHSRENAERCRRKAYQVRDPGLRAEFLELARQWDELAARVEKLGNEA